MFQFPGFASLTLYIQVKDTWLYTLIATPKGRNRVYSGGLPHSEIHGSKLILSSPWLIAEYHVLHRLLLPRHPPNALFALDLIQKKLNQTLLCVRLTGWCASLQQLSTPRFRSKVIHNLCGSTCLEAARLVYLTWNKMTGEQPCGMFTSSLTRDQSF